MPARDIAHPAVSRRMWEAVERLHGVCYTAPEVRERGAAAGLKGFWMNYFATRAAPLGPVTRPVVASTFFYYGPRRIARAIPDAWQFSTPEAVLEARFVAMDEALTRLLGPAGPQTTELLSLLLTAAEAGRPEGRTLYAGWADLVPPESLWAQVWWAATVLREHRSGSHLIALAAEGLDGCEAVVSHVAVGEAPEAWISDEAAWDDDAVSAARRRLVDRGWLLASTGLATEAGRAGRTRIERATDRLDLPLWLRLDTERTERLGRMLDALAPALPPDDQLDWKQLHRPGVAASGPAPD
ncbi:MAG: SCO6745 family protein [Acidimicrobiales bacterium]